MEQEENHDNNIARRIVESRGAFRPGLTVGGQEPVLGNFDFVLQQLQSLPSGFAERNRAEFIPRPFIDPQSFAGQLILDAEAIYSRLPYSHDVDQSRREIIEKYERAITEYNNTGKLTEQIIPLLNIGNHYLSFEYPINQDNELNVATAARFYDRAMRISEEIGSPDKTYLSINSLYTALCRCCAYYSDKDGDLYASYKALLEPLRQRAHFYSRKKQGGMEPDAHRIEEGEFGFSALEKIGTDNISQCLTIIARDPLTGKTGLVHIDKLNDIESLDAFFSQFEDNRLQLRLVGSRFTDQSTSSENIMKAMKYLHKQNADIISADVYDDDGPSAVIVDPVTFELTERVPGIANRNHCTSNALLLHTRRGEPLVQQFDFTKSPERSPIYLNTRLLERFRRLSFGMEEWEIEASLYNDYVDDRPFIVGYIIGLEEAFNRQLGGLNEALEQAIRENKLSPEAADRAREALYSQGFFVGENAETANSPVYNWINTLVSNNRLNISELGGVVVNQSAGQSMPANVIELHR